MLDLNQRPQVPIKKCIICIIIVCQNRFELLIFGATNQRFRPTKLLTPCEFKSLANYYKLNHLNTFE